jgi:toxin secretion/phage lysis holin
MKAIFEANRDLWSKLYDTIVSVWGACIFGILLSLDFVSKQIGGFSMLIILLFRLQIIDVCLGTYASIRGKGKHNPKFNSNSGIRGLDKKMVMWLWVWLAYQLDILWGLNTRDILVKAYCTFEIASIAEIWVNLKWFGYKSLEKAILSKITYLKNWALCKLCVKDKKECKACPSNNGNKVL